MDYFYCLILLFIPFILSYPQSHSNNFDRFLDKYLREQSGNMNEINNANSNEEFVVRRQNMFPHSSIHQFQRQIQPMCLPNIWTCGPNLPPCCPGLICYDGNAKRGRHCIARG